MMKLKNNGQALVEFIIILPIFIFLTFMIIDYGMISYNKNKIENIMNDVSEMYKNNETYEEIKKFIQTNDKELELNAIDKGKYIELNLSKKYNFLTPGISKLMNNYKIKNERTIYKNE